MACCFDCPESLGFDRRSIELVGFLDSRVAIQRSTDDEYGRLKVLHSLNWTQSRRFNSKLGRRAFTARPRNDQRLTA
jgi:hypothetical protein